MPINYYNRKKILDDLKYSNPSVTVIEDEKGKKVNTVNSTLLDDIAPIRQSTKKIDDSVSKKSKSDTWFKAGAFSDGYDFGDVTKTILGTATDVAQNFTKGALNITEGALDLGTYLVSGGLDLVGAKEQAKAVKEFGQKNLVEDLDLVNKTIVGTNPVLGVLNTGKSIYDAVESKDPKKALGAIPLFSDKTSISNTLNNIGSNDSVLGNKSDEIVQGVGYVGGMSAMAMLGVNPMATTFVTSMGNEMTNAFDKNASYGDAFVSGLISGGAEAGSEMLFGGLGNAIGKGALDDVVASGVGKLFKSQLGKNLSEFGIKSIGEGLEEIISSAGQEFGRAITYGSEYGNPLDFLKDEERMKEFLNGIIISAISQTPSAIKAVKSGRDYVSGYTSNEQKVLEQLTNDKINELSKQQTIENEVKKAISTRESEQGGSLSQKEIKSITEQINAKIDSGEITTYSSKLNSKQINNIRQEIVDNMNKGLLDTDRINKILGNTMSSKDEILAKSYEESQRKKEKFTYDSNKTVDSIEKELYTSASKYLNNTNRSHEFVDRIIRISRDTKTRYSFINNEELKTLGHDIKGKQVNGLVRINSDGKQTVLINVDSTKALNTIVGHETTHLLEGTQEYHELQDVIFKYAKEKGDFDTIQKNLIELYDIENVNIDSEVTADLVGDYLFTDEKFINNLSAEKTSLFNKIKDLIDNLIIKFKGTKEEKQLRKIQDKFKKAYKNAQNTNNNNQKNIIKYSIKEDERGNKYVNVDTNQDIFNGKKLYDQVKIAKQYILDNFRERGISVNNDNINVTSATANEYTHPKNQIPIITKESKMRASTELDNLLSISQYKYSAQDDGRHLFAKDGWDYYETIFKVGDNTFTGLINIAKSGNKKTLYDITNIKRISQNRSTSASAFSTSLANSLKNNIPQFNANVNSDISNNSISNEVSNDTKYSLTKQDEDIASVGKYNIYSKDVKKQPYRVLDDIAPVRTNKVDIDLNYEKMLNSYEEKNNLANNYSKNNQLDDEYENPNLTIKESNELKLENYQYQMDTYKKDLIQAIEGFNDVIKNKREEYESKKNKNTQAANNLLQQINRLQTQRDNVKVDYERRINNLQNKIDKMNSEEFKIAEQRMIKQTEYRQQARKLIGDTSTWTDKKLGIQYQVNTLKRNLRDIVKTVDGKADIARADAIYDEYQGNYDKNEAKLKIEANSIKQPYMDLKLTKQEDIYIQMLGEYKYNPDSKLTRGLLDNYYYKNQKNINLDKVNKTIKDARKTYDSLFKRTNEVLRNQGFKEIPYRKGYFPHFTEQKQGKLAKLFDWKVNNDDLPTDIAALTEFNNPERSWQSFNKHRTSDETDYSFSKGLDTYVKGTLDWIYHIEDIQKRRALENEIRYQHSENGVKEQIDQIYNDPGLNADQAQERIDLVYKNFRNPLNNFVTDLRNSTNNLAGKKSSTDRNLEYATNRRIYSTVTNLSNRVSGNMVGGSISSALTNFIPITQSWGEVKPTSSLKAMAETIKNTIKDDGTISKSTFLTNRLNEVESLYKSNWDKIGDKFNVLFDAIDSFTSQTVWRSKYNENIKNGMTETEAIKNADNFAEGVLAGRSRGNAPTIFNSKNPITKMLTAFQLEVNNQYQYMLKDMPTDVGSKSKMRLIKGYATMFLGAYAYNALYSSLTGRDAAFDPIGIIEDIIKELGIGDDDDDKSASEKFNNIFNNTVQELPFIGGLAGGGRVPISSAIPYENPVSAITDTFKDITNLLDNDKREKAWNDLTTEWLKPVIYLGLPFGGGQISKTIKGLSMYNDDLPISGSYTSGGDLRFTADNSISGKIKAGLFGQYSSKDAQDYIDSGFKSISKKNIDELKDLDMTSTEYRNYRNGLTKSGQKQSDKIEYISNLDVTNDQKNIMANNVLKRDYDVDMSDYDKYGSYAEFDYSYKNPEKYKWLTDNNISYEKYSSSAKSKEIYDYAYKNKDKYLISKTISNNFEDYYEYKKVISNIESDKKASKKSKVISYVNSLNLSIPQKAILIKSTSTFKFNDYNNDIVNYIDSLDLTYEEKIVILTELDMYINKDGIVTWK